MAAENGHRPATQEGLARVESKLSTEIAKLEDTIDRIIEILTEMRADLRDIKASMSTKDDISRVLTAIDAFTKQTMDNRRTLLVYNDILGKHETGIAAFEAKSS